MLDGLREQALQEQMTELWGAQRFADVIDLCVRSIEDQEKQVRSGKDRDAAVWPATWLTAGGSIMQLLRIILDAIRVVMADVIFILFGPQQNNFRICEAGFPPWSEVV